jgi:hypothetical protein
MASINVEISGLNELKNRFDSNTINRKLILATSLAIRPIAQSIDFATQRIYGMSAESVRPNKSSSNFVQGKNFISLGLTYIYKPIDLSKFPYTYQHIPSTNTGAVHTVMVRKGKGKQVTGRFGNGGFVPRNRKTNTEVWRGYNGGAQMFERVGKPRKHLRLLLGPSIMKQVEMVVRTDDAVKTALNQATQILADNFKL